MKRDHYGRKLRLTAQEIKEQADRAADRAAQKATFSENTTTVVNPPVPAVDPALTLAPVKKGGRPSKGGRDPSLHVRVPKSWIAALDRIAKREGISRMKAARNAMWPSLQLELMGVEK